MNSIVKRIEYRGHNINIYHDDDVESPRDWDTAGTIACFSVRYALGDKHSYNNSVSGFLCALVEETCKKEEIAAALLSMGQVSMDDIDKINTDPYYYMRSVDSAPTFYLSILDRHVVILPIFLYDHSGITIRTSPFSCLWDSGQVGYIYITYEKAKQEYGFETIDQGAVEKIKAYLINEVNIYDQYLTGDVYYYTVEPKENNKMPGCTDSCGGFYGHDFEMNGLMESARDCIDFAIDEYKKQTYIKHKRNKEAIAALRYAWTV